MGFFGFFVKLREAILFNLYVSVDDLDLLSEDYEAVDHRLQLFLDVVVFEEEEELHSFLKVMITIRDTGISETDLHISKFQSFSNTGRQRFCHFFSN